MKKYLFFLLFPIWMGSCAVSFDKKTVSLADFADDYNGSDITLALHKAIEYCKQVKASKLTIPLGQYEITSAFAFERYVWASNNDEGLKRIAFDLTGMEDFEIDGQGSLLLFYGFVSPFLINDSKRITVRDLNIDYARTFHSEGVITALYPDGLEILFSDSYPYKVKEDRLFFYDAEGTGYPYGNLLEFDPIKRETAFMVKDYWVPDPLIAKDLGERKVRIFKEGLTATVGNILVFGAADRLVPGFTLSESEDVMISQVNIYHCGGMGVIAQRSRNIELDRVQVTPAPGSGRVVSITADATHFVNCGGYIRMINCLFEQQKDDATNIHGIYAAIAGINTPKEIMVKFMHPQQYGFILAKPGDIMEWVAQKSLITLGESKIKTITPLNKEYIRIEFEEAVPSGVQLHDVVASVAEAPEVLIKGCTLRGNRARGLLLGSRAKMIIEENYFHIAGASILLEGDGNYWYEQSGVRDVIIRNNTFDNCNYGVWGNALIQVGSGIYENREQSRYHRNIMVENNSIKAFDPRLVNIYSVDGFVFRNNQIEETYAYPLYFQKAKPFVVEHCDEVMIEQ
ncbi:MAG: right-handed parallel beta-helix repeat-containing protein [Bacteroidetes bacterium]|nr:right-handed parallel beta-helix repeat-containing protein [Bacteroidota bacterium]